MRIIAGIDPGLEGGVAVLNEDLDVLETVDLPTMGDGKHRVLNCGALVRWLADRDVNQALIELAGSMPDQGLASSFRYGVSYGQLIGMLQTACIVYSEVSALKWKRHYGLLNNKKLGIVISKDDSRRKAIELFPRHAEQFLKKNSVHRAEAALIARFALRGAMRLF